jgi:hypothetical protein
MSTDPGSKPTMRQLERAYLRDAYAKDRIAMLDEATAICESIGLARESEQWQPVLHAISDLLFERYAYERGFEEWRTEIGRTWANREEHYDLFCDWIKELVSHAELTQRRAAFVDFGDEAILRIVAADMIEAAIPLPPPLREYIVKDLRRPRAEPIRQLGVRKHMPFRDILIVDAVERIVRWTNLLATRNEGHSGQRGGESACSIVAKAISMGEANVVKIWKRYMKRAASRNR